MVVLFEVRCIKLAAFSRRIQKLGYFLVLLRKLPIVYEGIFTAQGLIITVPCIAQTIGSASRLMLYLIIVPFFRQVDCEGLSLAIVFIPGSLVQRIPRVGDKG